MTKGAQNINNKDYYFFDNGIQLRNALRRASNGYTYYYGLDGAMVKNASLILMTNISRFVPLRLKEQWYVGNLIGVATISTLTVKLVSRLRIALFVQMMANCITMLLKLVTWDVTSLRQTAAQVNVITLTLTVTL